MHPGFIGWLRHARHAGHAGHAGCGSWAGFGPSEHAHEHGPHGHHGRGHHEPFEGGDPRFATSEGDDLGGGAFGVRRPLRFLAFKLGLRDEQVSELAAILGDLKTERAQSAVDSRRTTASLADAMASSTYDGAKVDEAGAERVKSAERLRDAVSRSLARIHVLLDEEQRKRFSYLLRTGVITV